LVLPLAGLEPPPAIDLGTLLQVLLGDLGEVLVEDRDRAPFGPLLARARVAVAPGFRGADPQIAHLGAVRGRPPLRIPAEIPDQNDLVHRTRHGGPPRPDSICPVRASVPGQEKRSWLTFA